MAMRISKPTINKAPKVTVPKMQSQKAPSMGGDSMSSYNTASKMPGMKGAISKYANKMNVI